MPRSESMSHDPLDPHVPALLRGDEVAFTAVYDLTAGLLASVANGLLGNRAMAEDVVQDVFVRLVMHRGSLHTAEGRAVRAWLLRAVRNRCLDVRGSAAQRLERTTDVFEERPGGSSELDELLESDLSPRLRAALALLTDDQRAALVLTHVAGMSGREVGEVLGRNRAAVYSLLRRAEGATRAALADPGAPTVEPRVRTSGP